MDINNNQQTNIFIKGMDTDTSDMLLSPESYREARNLRLSTNKDQNTGELHMIEGTSEYSEFFKSNNLSILKLCSIRDLIVVIASGIDIENEGEENETEIPFWCVYKAEMDENFTPVISHVQNHPLGNFISTVLNYESENNIYLYVADGLSQILKISLTADESTQTYSDIISYAQTQFPKIYAECTTGGQMKSGVVQYSYQIYKKHGTLSQMSTISNPVYIYKDGNSSAGSEGYDYNEISNKAVNISIDIQSNDEDIYLRIYRIHYLKKYEVPTITLIYDNVLINQFKDEGTENYQEYSVAEYTSLSTNITVKPKIIEQKDGYLFAANNKEDIHIEDPTFKKIKEHITDYFTLSQTDATFSNASTSNQCRRRTFRRGERYLFGVILYDKNDVPSEVIKIYDTNSYNSQDFSTIIQTASGISHNVSNGTINLYVPTVTLQLTSNQSKKAEIVQCINKVELVMAERSLDVKQRLYQGIIGRTLQGDIETLQNDFKQKYSNRVCPSGFISMMNIMHTKKDAFTNAQQNSIRDNFEMSFFKPSTDVFQFVSPEVLYDDENTKNIIKDYKSQLSIDKVQIYKIESNKNSSTTVITNNNKSWYTKSLNYYYFGKDTITRGITRVGGGEESSYIISAENMRGLYINLEDFARAVSTNSWRFHMVQGQSGTITTPTDIYLARRIYKYEPATEGGEGVDPQPAQYINKFINLQQIGTYTNGEEITIPYSTFTQYINGNAIKNEGDDLSYQDSEPYILFSNISAYCESEIQIQVYEDGTPYTITGDDYVSFGNSEFSKTGLPFITNTDNNSTAEGTALNYVDKKTTMLSLLYNRISIIRNEQPVLFNIGNVVDPGTIQHGSENIISNGDIKDIELYKSDTINNFSEQDRIKILDDVVPIGEYEYIPWTVPYALTFSQEDLIDGGIRPIVAAIANPLKFLRSDDVKWMIGAYEIQDMYTEGNWDDDSCLGVYNFAYPVATSGKCILINSNVQVSNSSDYYYKEQDTYAQNGLLPLTVVDIKKTPGLYSDDPVYYKFGDIIDVQNNETSTNASGGDTFVQVMEYNAAHVAYENYYYNLPTMSTVYRVPLETDIDISSEHGTSYTKQGNKWQIQDIPVAMPEYTQKESCYKYNPVYGYINNIFTAFEKYDDKKEVTRTDARIYASQKKELGEIIDSWLTFKPADFIDLNTSYGEITGMIAFKNQLVTWQNNATSVVGVNERALVTTTTDTNIMLGTGDVLNRYDYISDIYGMHNDQMCCTKSDSTLYWWDYSNRELLAYSGGQSVVPLTTIKNVRNYINSSSNNESPKLVYDYKYKELLASICSDTLVYSEQLQCFIGLYTMQLFENTYVVDTLFLSNADALYKWNVSSDIEIEQQEEESQEEESQEEVEQLDLPQVAKIYGSTITPSLKYIVNKEPQYNKTFDIVIIGGKLCRTPSILTDPETSSDKDKVQDLNKKYHKPMIDSISMVFTTPLNQSAEINNIDFTTINEYDYRMCVPRDGQKPGSIPKYGNRLKGKVMNCEIKSSSNSIDFSLQYITTKYRMSWG